VSAVAPAAAHALYALAWTSFGLGHSLLAAEAAKRRLGPFLGPFYRLAFNGIAVIHLGLVWLAGRHLLGELAPFDLGDSARLVLGAVHLAGWGLMAWGLSGYDLGRLAGTRQVRNHFRRLAEPEDEPLRTGGLHRFVRHPLYSAGFLILWGRAADPFGFATALWGSLYLIVGARFEEGKLLRLYGAAYAGYRRRVPAFLPWRGAVPPAGPEDAP
jgi:protein-S-isoprenylcysteine O-methyltransferase Ste14